MARNHYYILMDEDYNTLSESAIPDHTHLSTAKRIAREYKKEHKLENILLEVNDIGSETIVEILDL